MDITRSHGDVKVAVTGGGVRLGGVNGSATVQVGKNAGERGGRMGENTMSAMTAPLCFVFKSRRRHCQHTQTVDGPLDVRFEAIAPGTANTLATRRGRVELLMVRIRPTVMYHMYQSRRSHHPYACIMTQAPEIKAGLAVQGFAQRPESLLPEGPSGLEVTSHMGTRLEGRFTGARPEPSRKAAAAARERAEGQGQGQGRQHDAAPPPSAHGKGKIDLSGAEAQALKVILIGLSVYMCVCTDQLI